MRTRDSLTRHFKDKAYHVFKLRNTKDLRVRCLHFRMAPVESRALIIHRVRGNRRPMPRPLTLSLDGREFDVRIVKIDREKLYGRVEIEAYDEKGNQAQLLILRPTARR